MKVLSQSSRLPDLNRIDHLLDETGVHERQPGHMVVMCLEGLCLIALWDNGPPLVVLGEGITRVNTRY